MADFNSDLIAKLLKQPSEFVAPTEMWGKAQHALFVGTTGGTVPAANDRVLLTRVPAGARVIGGAWEIKAAFGASGTTGTLRTIKDNAVFSTNAGLSLHTPTSKTLTLLTDGVGRYLTEDTPGCGYCTVYLHLNAVATPVATGDFRGYILFTTTG